MLSPVCQPRMGTESIFAEWAEFFCIFLDEYRKGLNKEGHPRFFLWTTPGIAPARQLSRHSQLTMCP
jgi:hypothetical protein